MHSCCIKQWRGNLSEQQKSLILSRFTHQHQKSIIRHLGVSHLPRTHCLVVLVGPSQFQNIISTCWFLRRAQTVDLAAQPRPNTTGEERKPRIIWSSSISALHRRSVPRRDAARLQRPRHKPAAFLFTAIWIKDRVGERKAAAGLCFPLKLGENNTKNTIWISWKYDIFQLHAVSHRLQQIARDRRQQGRDVNRLFCFTVTNLTDCILLFSQTCWLAVI